LSLFQSIFIARHINYIKVFQDIHNFIISKRVFVSKNLKKNKDGGDPLHKHTNQKVGIERSAAMSDFVAKYTTKQVK